MNRGNIPKVKPSPGNDVLSDTLNRLIDFVNQNQFLQGDGRFITVQHVGSTRTVQFDPTPLGGPGMHLGLITASELQDGHAARWNYTITPAQFNSSGILTATAGASTITAINLVEQSHAAEPEDSEEAWYVWGVNAHDPDVTLTPLPVGGGTSDGNHTVNMPIEYRQHRDTGGTLRYYFRAIGSFYAECA